MLDTRWQHRSGADCFLLKFPTVFSDVRSCECVELQTTGMMYCCGRVALWKPWLCRIVQNCGRQKIGQIAALCSAVQFLVVPLPTANSSNVVTQSLAISGKIFSTRTSAFSQWKKSQLFPAVGEVQIWSSFLRTQLLRHGISIVREFIACY